MHQRHFLSSHNSIVAAVEDGGSYYNTRRPWSVICGKVFECTEHSADLNPSLAVSGPWPHTTRRSTHLLQVFSWEVFNHHPPYSSDLAPSDFHLFLLFKKFLPEQQQRFQNEREEEMSVTVVPIEAEDFYDTGCKSWFHGMTNVSIPEVTMWKNSLTLAVSVPRNIFIKFGFVSVNGPRETYFVDALCRFC